METAHKDIDHRLLISMFRIRMSVKIENTNLPLLSIIVDAWCNYVSIKGERKVDVNRNYREESRNYCRRREAKVIYQIVMKS